MHLLCCSQRTWTADRRNSWSFSRFRQANRKPESFWFVHYQKLSEPAPSVWALEIAGPGERSALMPRRPSRHEGASVAFTWQRTSVTDGSCVRCRCRCPHKGLLCSAPRTVVALIKLQAVQAEASGVPGSRCAHGEEIFDGGGCEDDVPLGRRAGEEKGSSPAAHPGSRPGSSATTWRSGPSRAGNCESRLNRAVRGAASFQEQVLEEPLCGAVPSLLRPSLCTQLGASVLLSQPT